MTLHEQTKEAAREYHSRYTTINDTFIAGVEWERQRDKWISVKDKKPDCVNILAFTGGLILTLTYINNKYYYGCNKWCSEVTHWQPLPELPKQTQS